MHSAVDIVLVPLHYRDWTADQRPAEGSSPEAEGARRCQPPELERRSNHDPRDSAFMTAPDLPPSMRSTTCARMAGARSGKRSSIAPAGESVDRRGYESRRLLLIEGEKTASTRAVCACPDIAVAPEKFTA
jgi:hypothetical protein